VDQLGLAAIKFRGSFYRRSILRIIWPLLSVDDFTEDFLKKLTKTGHWTGYLGFTVNSTVADIFNIGMKYSTEMNPTPLAVFDEQHIGSSFKEFLFLELLVRYFFKALLERAWFAARRRWKHHSYGQVRK
jgi:hypothetical protein